MPLCGPLLLWRGIASWSRLASLLLKQGLPAPDALRLAATGVDDALLAVEGLRLAKATAQGASVADALQRNGSLPESLVPIVDWGQQQGVLPAAFETVAEMAENRLRLRVALLRTILPPVAFICIAVVVLWFFHAMFGPLVVLITSLSGGSHLYGGSAKPAATIDPTLIATAVFGLSIALAALAIVIRLVAAMIRGPRPKSRFMSAVTDAIRIFYWIAFFIALFIGLTAGTNGAIGFLLWWAAVVVALMISNQRKRSAQQSLVWMLGTAVAKGIPLATVARAFGEERSGSLAAKARRLAQQLDCGVSLDEAMHKANISIPTDALVALRTGYVTRSAMPLIRSAEHHAATDAVIHSATAKVVYAMVFTLFSVSAIAFIVIKTVPAYIKMFDDFGRALPETTLAFIGLAHAVAHGGAIFSLLLFAFVLATVYAVLRYIGVGRWDPPLVRMVSRPLDSSIVLRSLADAVERGSPISSMVDGLAQKYPKPYIKMRLYSAANRIANGSDWCESLHAVGLLSPAEAGLLKAAESVGNLAWAMNELAERLSRKFIARVHRILAIGFPLMLILFAALVCFVASAMIEPLADLVISLSSGTRGQ
ncbi:MAG: type II secretion system F family protein [Pirellulales bacterium]|nr:type II secretion system F family protein [Pirellulales bacterium]